eukprot:GEMP01045252.1.p1 GENE.GEMP01045252.1~~GEMP01045252.1.p1  ORF type:complete len:252 (+),score=53.39 GEMP01045252.1:211-966(+)
MKYRNLALDDHWLASAPPAPATHATMHHDSCFILPSFIKKKIWPRGKYSHAVEDLRMGIRDEPHDWMTVGNIWRSHAYHHYLDAHKASQMSEKFSDESARFAAEAQALDSLAYKAALAQTAQSEAYGILHGRVTSQMRDLCTKVKHLLEEHERPGADALYPDEIADNVALWNRQSMLQLRRHCGRFEQFLSSKYRHPLKIPDGIVHDAHKLLSRADRPQIAPILPPNDKKTSKQEILDWVSKFLPDVVSSL